MYFSIQDSVSHGIAPICNGCYTLINVIILTQHFHEFFFNFAHEMIILLHTGLPYWDSDPNTLISLESQNPKLRLRRRVGLFQLS